MLFWGIERFAKHLPRTFLQRMSTAPISLTKQGCQGFCQLRILLKLLYQRTQVDGIAT